MLHGGLTVTEEARPVPDDVAAPARESPDDEMAFERAYESEFPRVYGYIRYRVGNGDTADDLTSQTFLKALDRLSTFDPRKADIGPWVLGIARNVVGITCVPDAAGAGCRSTGSVIAQRRGRPPSRRRSRTSSNGDSWERCAPCRNVSATSSG